jgi:hypothetical protein
LTQSFDGGVLATQITTNNWELIATRHDSLNHSPDARSRLSIGLMFITIRHCIAPNFTQFLNSFPSQPLHGPRLLLASHLLSLKCSTNIHTMMNLGKETMATRRTFKIWSFQLPFYGGSFYPPCGPTIRLDFPAPLSQQSP